MSEAGGFVVTYGRVSDPARAVAAEGRDLAAAGTRLGRQVALIPPGAPALRLNSAGWLDAAPDVLASLAGAADLRALCEARIDALAPHFAVATSRFVRGYLAQAGSSAPAPPTDAVRLAAISSPADAFFDALLPLPNAWIAAGRPGVIVERPERAGFVRVDVAFWSGHELVAVMLRDASSVFGRSRAGLDGLSDAVRLIWWPSVATSRAPLLRSLVRAAHDGLPEAHVSFGPIRNPDLRFAPQA